MSADVHTGPIATVEESPSTAIAERTDSGRAPALASEFGAHSMQQLLHFAIERGTPVESLEKLVDLAERMEAREARKAFADALAKFQAECRPIFRAKKVSFASSGGGDVKYDYASLDDIVTTIAPILAKCDLAYTWNTRIDKNMLTVDTIVRHIAGHSETTSFTLPIDSKASMSEQQKYGAALTFGQRRGLSSALGLVTTSEDPDSPKLDPTPINDDQALFIEDLLKETRAPVSRFLRYFDAGSVPQIRAVDYDAAVATLEEMRAKKAGRA